MPPQFTLHARNPEHNVQIGGDAIAFCSVASAPNAQDLDGGLPVDFFVASFPTTSEVLRGPLPVIVVYDTDGEELGRSDLDEAVVRRE